MKSKNILLILLGTFILTIISFYNGYPLVYSDTGTYLYSGFDKFIPFDRPITYGLFVFAASLKTSLWFVVLIQNFFTCFLIFEVCKLFFKTEILPISFLGIITFLTFFTGIAWYSNQIMPDFFAPITALLTFLILYSPKINIFKLIFFSILFIFSSIVHLSHLIFIFILIFFNIFLEKLLTKKQIFVIEKLKFQRIFLIFALIIVSWFTLPTINYLTEKKFIVSKGSYAFFIAHLADTGILEKFLRENCEKTEYKNCKLCQYKDSLPQDLAAFLWTPNGVFAKTGGWEGEEEYKKIVFATLKEPKYLVLNIYKSMTYGFSLLFRNEIGQGLSAYNEGSAPYGQIHWRFHYELNNYLSAKQNIWNGSTLNLKTLNIFNFFLNIFSFFCVLLIFFTSFYKRIDNFSLKFLIFSLSAIFVNAFITAGLNSSCERFQARIVWLLPLALLIIFIKNFEILKEKLNFSKES